MHGSALWRSDSLSLFAPGVETVKTQPADHEEQGDELRRGQEPNASAVVIAQEFDEKASDSVQYEICGSHISLVLCMFTVDDEKGC